MLLLLHALLHLTSPPDMPQDPAPLDAMVHDPTLASIPASESNRQHTSKGIGHQCSAHHRLLLGACPTMLINCMHPSAGLRKFQLQLLLPAPPACWPSSLLALSKFRIGLPPAASLCKLSICPASKLHAFLQLSAAYTYSTHSLHVLTCRCPAG